MEDKRVQVGQEKRSAAGHDSNMQITAPNQAVTEVIDLTYDPWHAWHTHMLYTVRYALFCLIMVGTKVCGAYTATEYTSAEILSIV